MVIDLLIESDAPAGTQWTAMAKSLVQRGKQSPPFNLLMRQTDPPVPDKPGWYAHLSLCMMAADVTEAMPPVFEAIESAGRASRAAFAIYVDHHGDGAQLLASGSFFTDLQSYASAEIASALAREGDGSIKTPDEMRQIFDRASGIGRIAVVRQECITGAVRYSQAASNGARLLARPSPTGRGWLVVERAANGDSMRAWTTAPQAQHFGLMLQLPYYLQDIDGQLELVFSHARVSLKADANPNRTYFSSSIGPLSVHSREVGASRGQLHVVIEIPQLRQTRSYLVPRGSLPQGWQVISSVPF